MLYRKHSIINEAIIHAGAIEVVCYIRKSVISESVVSEVLNKEKNMSSVGIK